MLIVLGWSTNLENLTGPFQTTQGPSKWTVVIINNLSSITNELHLQSLEWYIFVFLFKYVVAHLGEKLVLEVGASTLCLVNPYPQNFVMQLNTIRLHCSWSLVSLTIWSYSITTIFSAKKASFYQAKVI